MNMILETRTCVGGCGRTFRCLPTSNTTHARADCDWVCKGARGGSWVRATPALKKKVAAARRRSFVKPGSIDL